VDATRGYATSDRTDRGPVCADTAGWRIMSTCGPVFLVLLVAALACTQETQNKLGRAVQNWTGTDGVLDVYAGEKLVLRFIQIDKLTTASGTGDGESRAYRYGYGILDENQNYVADPGEKKLYFEVSDYSTSYVFYENPR
jgi:hypothetical protein